MKKTVILEFLLVIIFSSLVMAHGEETFDLAEEIIKEKIACEQLSDEQLESIGDYYMEQMHPENHKEMDELMGGEGSESLRQMHINIARSFYCGEHGVMSVGMMDLMMGRNGGIMNGNMMGYNAVGYSTFRFITSLLYVILIVGLIILIYLWIRKLLSDSKKRK